MRVSVRGWGRDHGQKEIIDTDIEEVAISGEIDAFHRGKTYLQVIRRVSPHPSAKGKLLPPKVHVWTDAKLNLCGSYQAHVEMDRDEIARLFYLTHKDQDLSGIVEMLAGFRKQDAKEIAA
jgi:hypothetical protein